MNYKIENEHLAIEIKAKGAELASVMSKNNELEYMWSGDPAVWGKTSPVLFPFVGTLKNNTFLFEGKEYSLPRHGFARDLEFEVEKRGMDSITFLLKSSEKTLVNYPFHFELRLMYTLTATMLQLSYEVKNTGNDTMYFSVGGHPAFAVPLVKGSAYEDHYLEFSKTENADKWLISADGLIKAESEPLIANTNKLALKKSLFYNDALVFKNLNSTAISLKSTSHAHGLDFHFDGFPFMGIWGAKDADFVCIEPWCGIADSVGHNQQLTSKEGIERISQGASWSRAWKINFY